MASPRPGKLPLILGALTALGPLSIDMYLPSFQAIARDLAASPARVQLTLAVYFIALGIGQAFYGPISDRFGRRRPLCVGLSVYVLASAGCALAGSIETLIAVRFVQALGGTARAWSSPAPSCVIASTSGRPRGSSLSSCWSPGWRPFLLHHWGDRSWSSCPGGRSSGSSP